jgi:predicted O-linked N-acetylglucosamine transferase (SPINDLY family)
MSILQQVPKAKIWMLKFSHAAQKYLWKEAEKQGISADRLVFREFICIMRVCMYVCVCLCVDA